MRADVAAYQPFEENFDIRVLDSVHDKMEAGFREAAYIRQLRQEGKELYNVLAGAPQHDPRFWGMYYNNKNRRTCYN
jgi:hypothetical protein